MRVLVLAVTILASIWSRPADAIIGVCRGRSIPWDKTRELRNLRLECTAAADHYIRRPQPFDVKAWRKLEMSQLRDKRQRMQEVGRGLAPIEWKGSIPYETVEAWEWTESVYGPDPVCGFDTTEYTDSNGNTTTFTTMRSCWHDVSRHEERHCSNEVIRYEAEFVRPSLQDWGPHVRAEDELASYYDILPNKYDLLPGEVEDVQVFNNWYASTTVKPLVEVGDAWNEYAFDLRFADGSSEVVCQHDVTRDLDVKIHTVKRLRKRGPNAFRAGIDDYGRPLADTFEWQEAAGTDGKYTKSIPRALRLLDVSETLITALARQSRDFAARIERAKADHGVGANTTAEESKSFEADKGFWEDTHVRVHLMRKRYEFGVDGLARDQYVSHYIYLRGADVSDRGRYNLVLVSDDKNSDLYRTSGPFSYKYWNHIRLNLEPGATYEFQVSMYKKGVPFYAQDCDDPRFRNHWNCRLGLRGENSWFSKELPIPFVASATFDNRGWLQRINDFQGKSITEKVRSFMPW